MNQAVLYTNYGAQYVFCKSGNLYFSEIQEKPKSLSPVLVSGAENFDIFYESEGRLALFLKTRKDTWTKMLIIKNRLMYYGNAEGSFSMADVSLLGYCSSRKEIYLFSSPKSSIIKINTENGKSETVEDNAAIFNGGIYHYGSKSLIAYIKNGRMCLFDTQTEKRMIISENARAVKDMSLCINNGKIYVLMIVNNGRMFNLELYAQGEKTIHILRLRSAKNCVITSNGGTLNIGICDEHRLAFMRSENSRTKFSPPTENEMPDVVKVNYISLDSEFSASHIFADSSGRPIMPNVLSPEVKEDNELPRDDDMTDRLKNKLGILEEQLKNKEEMLKGISAEYSQKQVNDGRIISLLRKSLEEAERKNNDLIKLLNELENKKRKFESQKSEIIQAANVMMDNKNAEKKSSEPEPEASYCEEQKQEEQESEINDTPKPNDEVPMLEDHKAEVPNFEAENRGEKELAAAEKNEEEQKMEMKDEISKE
jgi:hypothetical protein